MKVSQSFPQKQKMHKIKVQPEILEEKTLNFIG